MAPKRNESHWELKSLVQEIRQLQREEGHLRRKSSERPLSSWELSRLSEVLEDISTIVQNLNLKGNKIGQEHHSFSLYAQG